MKVTKQTVRVTPPGGDDTPTQQAVRMGAQEHCFTDADGKEYVVRNLSKMEFLQFSRKMGAENSANAMWFNFALAAATVRSVDGRVFRIPTEPEQVEKRIDGMSDDALNQIVDWIRSLGDQNQSEDEVMAAAKN